MKLCTTESLSLTSLVSFTASFAFGFNNEQFSDVELKVVGMVTISLLVFV